MINYDHYICVFLIVILLHQSTFKCISARKVEVDFVVVEESANNTFLGNLPKKLLTAGKMLTEELHGFNYQFMGRNRYFGIDSASGDISVLSRIDRESLCRTDKTCCSPTPNKCFLRALVINLNARGSESQNLVEVVFYITDINDNPPAWPTSFITLDIPEHTPINSRFKLPNSLDPDQGPQNTTDRYDLVTTSQGMFSLQPELIENKWNEAKEFVLWLQIEKDLDREVQNFYQIVVSAVDGANFPLTGYVTVNISITDINDQKPIFNMENPVVTVNENLPIHSKIYQVKASDPDPTDKIRLRYKMGSSVTNKVSKVFQIDEITGDIFLREYLDYEKSWEPYKIPISVTDGKHITETTLTVNVRNENDNPPQILVNSHLMKGDGSLWIKENKQANQLIATFSVTDPDDRQQKEELRCHTSNSMFVISPLYDDAVNQFKLISIVSFDRERVPMYTLNIECSDNGNPAKTAITPLTINVEDENDSPPKFSKPFYRATVREGAPHDTHVTQVTATDADSSEQTKINYYLDEYSKLSFRIESNTGTIYTQTVFDREKTKEINITVYATDFPINSKEQQFWYKFHSSRNREGLSDEGRVKRINTASVIVQVNIFDVNDCSPRFEQNSYEFEVEESRRNFRVGKVTARDDDVSQRNNRVTYYLKNNPSYPKADNYFKVNVNTGEIYTISNKIDREQTPVIPFQVVARDQGQPSQSTLVDILVHILDVNDEKPTWVFPKGANKSVNISQEVSVGHKIVQVQAVDLDEGPRGQLSYTIVHGNEKDYFDLDSKSGELYLAKPLPNEAVYLHKLFLKVTDHGNPPEENTCELQVNILTRSLYHKLNNRHVEKDLVIMICMIVTTLVISLILIVTLVFLRCQFCRRLWMKRRLQQPYTTTVRVCNPDGRSSPTFSELPHLMDDFGRPIAMFSRLEALDEATSGAMGEMGDRPPVYYTLEARPVFSADSASLDSGRGYSDTGGPPQQCQQSRGLDRAYSLSRFTGTAPRLIKGVSETLAKTNNCTETNCRSEDIDNCDPHSLLLASKDPNYHQTSALLAGDDTDGGREADGDQHRVGLSSTFRGPLQVTWVDDPSGYQHLDYPIPLSTASTANNNLPVSSRKKIDNSNLTTLSKSGGEEKNDMRVYTPLKSHRVSTPNLYTAKQPTSFV